MSNLRQEAVRAIANAERNLNRVDFKKVHIKDLFGMVTKRFVWNFIKLIKTIKHCYAKNRYRQANLHPFFIFSG